MLLGGYRGESVTNTYLFSFCCCAWCLGRLVHARLGQCVANNYYY